MRGIWHRLADDEGMTLIEIMVSAAIMFIILTGVLGLVLQTTMMGLQAKQKNVMTNALNGYVEWVQSLPFSQVALTSNGGVLDQTVQTISGYTVTIVPTVEPVTGIPELKKLTVVATLTDAQGRSVTQSTTVSVRDRSAFLTNAADPSTKPHVEFGSLMPPDKSVVWGSVWGNPSAPSQLYLDVKAKAADDRTIKEVEITFSALSGGVLKCESPEEPPRTALWTPLTKEWSSTADLFAWNTLQTTPVYDSADNVIGTTRVVADGMRQIVVKVTDSADVTAVIDRYLLVDNDPPPAPSSEASKWAISVANARTASARWAKVWDGTSPADSYRLEWVAQPMSATAASVTPFGTAPNWGAPSSYAWPNASEYEGDTMTYALTALQPFSRYAARVRAASPRGLPSAWTTERLFVTRPLLTGTYTITRPNNNTVRTVSTLSVTPPAFPTSGAVTYRWERSAENQPFTVLAAATGPTLVDTYDDDVKNKNAAYDPVLYRVTVSYTAAGFGSAVGSSLSNTVSTVTGLATPVTNRAYTEGTW